MTNTHIQLTTSDLGGIGGTVQIFNEDFSPLTPQRALTAEELATFQDAYAAVEQTELATLP